MSHSNTYLAIHIIFATKKRIPMIPQSRVKELHAVIGQLINESGGKTILVGGTRDHVHAALLLQADASVTALVRQIKSNSSRWITRNAGILGRFEWQGGYFALSVSPSQVDTLIAYISRQEEHHRFVSFDDELSRYRSITGTH